MVPFCNFESVMRGEIESVVDPQSSGKLADLVEAALHHFRHHPDALAMGRLLLKAFRAFTFCGDQDRRSAIGNLRPFILERLNTLQQPLELYRNHWWLSNESGWYDFVC